jgi:hypothetical protein
LGEVIRPVAALVRKRLGGFLDAALAPPELARLRAEGAALRSEEAFRLGFDNAA